MAIVDGAIVATYTIYICQNLTRSGRPFALVENVICAPPIAGSASEPR